MFTLKYSKRRLRNNQNISLEIRLLLKLEFSFPRDILCEPSVPTILFFQNHL